MADGEIEKVVLVLFSLGIEPQSANRAIGRLGVLAWIRPQKVLIPLAQGFLNLIHGQYAAARRNFACAVELDTNNALALLGAGLTARYQGRLIAAAQYLLRILKLPAGKGLADVQKYAAGVLNEVLHGCPVDEATPSVCVVSESNALGSQQVPYLPGPPVGVVPF